MLTGPTGTGKTEIALALAREYPVEIVSVDSAQVYRGLDIGSAKPSAQLRAQVPHHLIDLVEPSASYSAGQFVRDAAQAIDDIEARGRVPLLVGGTMLYLRALIERYRGAAGGRRGNSRASSTRRRRSTAGRRCTHAWRAIDPAAAARIHPNDAQRIQRALEVHAVDGRAASRSCRRRRGRRWRAISSSWRSFPTTGRGCMPRSHSASSR